MITVFKYPLVVDDRQNVETFEGAEVLCAQVQPVPGGESVCVWLLVDDSRPLVKRTFGIAGTGHPLDKMGLTAGVYVGTVQLAGGRLVFHVFDLGEVPR